MPRTVTKAQKKEEALRMRKVREKMGLTQAQLAEKLRVVPSAVNQWESGNRTIPGPVMVLVEMFEKSA